MRKQFGRHGGAQRGWPRFAVGMVLAGCASVAAAQESTSTPAATQPAVDAVALRETLRLTSSRRDPRTGEDRQTQLISETTASVGLLGNLSLTLDIPVVLADRRRTPSGLRDTDSGVADFSVYAKWRIYQLDSSPVNTLRLSLVGGLELPTGDGRFSSDSVDPLFGIVLTSVQERWGFNAALRTKINTSGGGSDAILPGDSPADAFRHDSSVLYRLDPAAFSAATEGATYAMLELNGLYEANGDYELRIAPGILYEGRSMALELSVILPAYQHISHRAPTNWGLAVGFRLLF